MMPGTTLESRVLFFWLFSFLIAFFFKVHQQPCSSCLRCYSTVVQEFNIQRTAVCNGTNWKKRCDVHHTHHFLFVCWNVGRMTWKFARQTLFLSTTKWTAPVTNAWSLDCFIKHNLMSSKESGVSGNLQTKLVKSCCLTWQISACDVSLDTKWSWGMAQPMAMAFDAGGKKEWCSFLVRSYKTSQPFHCFPLPARVKEWLAFLRFWCCIHWMIVCSKTKMSCWGLGTTHANCHFLWMLDVVSQSQVTHGSTKALMLMCSHKEQFSTSKIKLSAIPNNVNPMQLCDSLVFDECDSKNPIFSRFHIWFWVHVVECFLLSDNELRILAVQHPVLNWLDCPTMQQWHHQLTCSSAAPPVIALVFTLSSHSSTARTKNNHQFDGIVSQAKQHGSNNKWHTALQHC